MAVFLLMIGLVVAVSLAIAFSMMPNIVRYIRNRRNVQRDGIKVAATVIDVQVKQNWKDGERRYRDAWSGNMEREKIWQTYYDIIAQWTHPQTGQLYTLRSAIWSDEVTKAPIKGDSVLISVDPHNPQRYRVVTLPSPTVPHAPSPLPTEYPSPAHSATEDVPWQEYR
jgi:hypothetical protein